jgi:cyclic pyranopterin phosphate synthase
MPSEIFNSNWQFIPHEEMLTYEEIVKIIDCFKKFGLKKIRLTGGEPLLRKDLHKLIKLIKCSHPNIEIALTTNGSLLDLNSKNLKLAGLDRITISLDALDPELFEKMNDTKIPVNRVLNGIKSAINEGFANLKINCVIKKDINENQIIPLIKFFKNKNVILRFIEFMDVGNSNN